MSDAELGGDPPCWAHMFEDDDSQAQSAEPFGPLIVDLDDPQGSGGAIWSLPHGGDLDANLVRLEAGAQIGAHVNNEVDVVMIVQSGMAEVTIDGHTHLLGPTHLASIPKGLLRSITAGADGVTYLSVHRRRDPLGITRRD